MAHKETRRGSKEGKGPQRRERKEGKGPQRKERSVVLARVVIVAHYLGKSVQ